MAKNNLEAFDKFLQVINKEALTAEQFKSAFAALAKKINTHDQENKQFISTIKSLLEEKASNLSEKNKKELADIKTTVSNEINRLSVREEALLKVVEKAMDEVRDGLDADEEFVIEKATEQAKEKVLPLVTEHSKFMEGEMSKLGEQISVAFANQLISDEKIKKLDEFAKKAQRTISGGMTQARVLQLISENGGGGAVEGTDVLSTGETGGTKFLRENGDGTCSWITISGGGDALTANPLSQFASTTSAQLAGVLSDETGTGSAVFSDSPTLVTPNIGVATATSVNKVAFTAPATSATVVATDGTTTTLSGGTHSGTNTGDQDLSSYQVKPAEGEFVDGDKTKLDGIETGADVTDTTNVTAAGALMDSEVTNLSGIKTLTLPDSTTITAAAATVLDDATVGAMVDTLGGATSTGTGGLVRATSPTLVTPILGTPTSGTLTNCTGLPTAGLVSKTGADISVVTGTAGTSGNLAQWNIDGDLVDAGFAVTTGTPGKGSILVGDGTSEYDEVTAGTNDQIVVYDSAQANGVKKVDLDSGINFIIDGGGSAITTGIKGDVEIPFDCTIESVTLLADQSGSIVIDIWKDTYANYPATDADSITASAVPTISTATKSQDATLTGWTTALTKGDILRFNVDSITTCTRVTLSLKVRRNF